MKLIPKTVFTYYTGSNPNCYLVKDPEHGMCSGVEKQTNNYCLSKDELIELFGKMIRYGQDLQWDIEHAGRYDGGGNLLEHKTKENPEQFINNLFNQ